MWQEKTGWAPVVRSPIQYPHSRQDGTLRDKDAMVQTDKETWSSPSGKDQKILPFQSSTASARTRRTQNGSVWMAFSPYTTKERQDASAKV